MTILRNSVGGVAFGWVCGWITGAVAAIARSERCFVLNSVAVAHPVLWLNQVFADASVEITTTIAAAYLTFWVAQASLGVSGVLAVVTLGIIMNRNQVSNLQMRDSTT